MHVPLVHTLIASVVVVANIFYFGTEPFCDSCRVIDYREFSVPCIIGVQVIPSPAAGQTLLHLGRQNNMGTWRLHKQCAVISIC